MNTPFPIKLLVLGNCVLAAILHACKAWGDLSDLAPKLESIELDLLKSALGVKKGTPTDTIYQELNRGSIVSKIMDRQYAFVQKLDRKAKKKLLSYASGTDANTLASRDTIILLTTATM